MFYTKLFKLTALLTLPMLFVLSGCSTGTDYWRNRADDAADIFTFTAGTGFGVKARVFGFQFDTVYSYTPAAGLRGGEAFTSEKHSGEFHAREGNIGFPLPLVNAEIFYPNEYAAQRGKALEGSTPFMPFFLISTDSISKSACTSCYWDLKRGKEKLWQEYIKDTPENVRVHKADFMAQQDRKLENSPDFGGPHYLKFYKAPWYIYTDVNITLALFGGFQFGFNPGELFDLLLGFYQLDIFGDDV